MSRHNRNSELLCRDIIFSIKEFEFFITVQIRCTWQVILFLIKQNNVIKLILKKSLLKRSPFIMLKLCCDVIIINNKLKLCKDIIKIIFINLDIILIY